MGFRDRSCCGGVGGAGRGGFGAGGAAGARGKGEGADRVAGEEEAAVTGRHEWVKNGNGGVEGVHVEASHVFFELFSVRFR